MIPLLVVINVIASLTLILFILLHAGRGGGLSDMFGGGMNTSLGGWSSATWTASRWERPQCSSSPACCWP
jgi:preprotein translocase subunit SecG